MSIKRTFTKVAVGASLLTSLTICAVGGAFSGHHSFAPVPVVDTVALFNPRTPDTPEGCVAKNE